MVPYILPSLSGGLLAAAFLLYHAGALHQLEDPIMIGASLAFGASAGFYAALTLDDRPTFRAAYTGLTVVAGWLGVLCLSPLFPSA